MAESEERTPKFVPLAREESAGRMGDDTTDGREITG
jgi:hypothetical protein